MANALLLICFLASSLLVSQGQSETSEVTFFQAQSIQSTKPQTPAQGGNLLPQPTCPGGRELQETGSFGEYTVRVYGSFLGGCFEILKNGSRIYSQMGDKLTLEAFEGKKSVPIGTKITGTGNPDLVIAEWTGGVHCCFLYHIFEIGKTFHHVDTIDTKDGSLGGFVNLDSDPALEFKSADWTFAYWRTSFAFSPAIEVILKYRDGKFRFATDFMKSRPPDLSELKRSASEVLEKFSQDKRQTAWWAAIWVEALKLIYSGNAHLVPQYLDLSWPPERDDKLKVIEDFKNTLKKSPFYDDLVSINGGHLF
jgi:hypothetical protein